MADIIRKNDNLDRKDTALSKTSGVSILQRIQGQKRAFLADVSGSMEERVADGTKIAILNGLLESLREELKTSRLFAFSDSCREIKLDGLSKIPELYTEGGTQMHRAFSTLKDLKVEHVVLLTDGQPDIESAALSAANGLKIDVVYIGPQPLPDFLKKLAQRTGGTFHDQNMLKEGSSLLLTGKIKALLTAGKK